MKEQNTNYKELFLQVLMIGLLFFVFSALNTNTHSSETFLNHPTVVAQVLQSNQQGFQIEPPQLPSFNHDWITCDRSDIQWYNNLENLGQLLNSQHHAQYKLWKNRHITASLITEAYLQYSPRSSNPGEFPPLA